MVATEYCSIHPSSDDFPYGYLSLWDEDDVRALAKIADVLPPEMREEVETSTLLVNLRPPVETKADLGVIRKAIRSERILKLTYSDESGTVSVRRIWPFALSYYEQVRVVAAWCELRQDFRHFRTDRIIEMIPQGVRYPRRRAVLLKAWHDQQDARIGE